MKKRIIILLSLIMISMFVFAGCGNKEAGSPVTGVNTPKEVTGEIIDAGRVSALCPDGWRNFGVPDLFSDDKDAIETNKLLFRKGSKDESDYSKPGISISYYGENETFYKLNKTDFEEPKDLGPIELGGRTWEGFTASDSGQQYVWLWSGTSDSNEEFLVNFMNEYAGEKISIDDADLQAIISSIKFKSE